MEQTIVEHGYWKLVVSHFGAFGAFGKISRMKSKIHDFRRSQIVVEQTAEAAPVPFHQQGRLSMNTAAKIDERLALRRAPMVMQALQIWWLTAQHSEREAGMDGMYVHKDNYVQLSRKLYKALVEDWNDADATAVAEEEWTKDCEMFGGVSRMSRELFQDAIFE